MGLLVMPSRYRSVVVICQLGFIFQLAAKVSLLFSDLVIQLGAIVRVTFLQHSHYDMACCGTLAPRFNYQWTASILTTCHFLYTSATTSTRICPLQWVPAN